MQKCLIYFFLMLVVISIVRADLSGTAITKGWTVISKTGTEAQLTFWKSGTDKKVELGWLPPDNSCSGWATQYLYDSDGNRIKDDKNKDIALKCESSKCDGFNCYHISLTDAQAVNIDDYVKLGENSIVTVYQEESKIIIEDTQIIAGEEIYINCNHTIYKKNGSEYVLSPNDIYVFPQEDRLKSGANDNNIGLHSYKYVTECNYPLEYYEEDKYIIKFVDGITYDGGNIANKVYNFKSHRLDYTNLTDLKYTKSYWLDGNNLTIYFNEDDGHIDPIDSIFSFTSGGIYSTIVYSNPNTNLNDSAVFGGLGKIYAYNYSGTNLWNLSFSNNANAKVYDMEILQLTGRFTPTSMYNDTATQIEWGLEGIQTFNDNLNYTTTETVGIPAFITHINFTNVTGEFSNINTRYWYSGNLGHNVNVNIWNYDTTSWDTLGQMVDTTQYIKQNYAITDYTPYVQNGLVQTQIAHTTAGNINHQLRLDYFVLEKSTKDDYIAVLSADGTRNGTYQVIDNKGIRYCQSGNYGIGYTMDTFDKERSGERNYTASLVYVSSALSFMVRYPNCSLDKLQTITTAVGTGFPILSYAIKLLVDDIDADGYNNDMIMAASIDTPAPPPPLAVIDYWNESYQNVWHNELWGFNTRPHDFTIGNFTSDKGKEIIMIISSAGASEVDLINSSGQRPLYTGVVYDTQNWLTLKGDYDNNGYDDFLWANGSSSKSPIVWNGSFNYIWESNLASTAITGSYNGITLNFLGLNEFDSCIGDTNIDKVLCFNQSGFNFANYTVIGDIGSAQAKEAFAVIKNTSSEYLGDLLVVGTLSGYGYFLNASGLIPTEIPFVPLDVNKIFIQRGWNDKIWIELS